MSHSHHKSFGSLTSFAPEVEEELERTNPGLLTWLQTSYGILFQGFVISIYVFFDTTSGLIMSRVLKPDPTPEFTPLPSSMIVVNSGSSIVIGLLITVAILVCKEKVPMRHAIPQTFVTVYRWRSIVSYSFVAALFSIASVFSMLAYSKLDAGLKKILDQLKLPVIAGMGTLILGRRYNIHQWFALLMVALSVCNFYFIDLEHDETTELRTQCHYPQHCFDVQPHDICALRVDGRTITGEPVQRSHIAVDRRLARGTHNITTFESKAAKTEWTGLTFSLIATCCNCLGSLFDEIILKSGATIPFSVQKVQMETTGFLVSISMSFIVPLWIDSNGGKAVWWTKTDVVGSGQGFFQGYNRFTFIAITLDTLLAWMSGLIVKKFSALVHKIAKCFVLLLTVLCAGIFFKPCQAEELPLTMYALAFVTSAATVLFITMPQAS